MPIKMIQSPLFLLIFLLCSTPSASAESAIQKKARLFVTTFLSVTEMHITKEISALEDPKAYTLISEDKEGENYQFEARGIEEEMGQKVMGFITPTSAGVSMEVTDVEAFKHTAMEARQRAGLFHHYEKRQDGEVAHFRLARFELETLYYEVRLTTSGQGARNTITLGFYRQNRQEVTAIFEDPKAQWELLDTGTKNGLYTPKARVQISRFPHHAEDVFGIHTVEILFAGPSPWMIFTPGLYPMWSKKNEAGEPQKFFFDTLTGIYIDDIPFKRYLPLGVPINQNEKQFAIQLDETSLTALKNGSTIRFELLTTGKEKSVITFPLRKSGDVITQAMALYKRNGITPLISMVIKGEHRAVKKLLAQGADVNAQALTGIPALALAVKAKDAKMIRLLGTAQGLDTAWKNKNGDGYLHTAAHYYRGTAVMEALLSIGCDPNIRDSEGRAPLSRSVCYEGQGKLDILLKAGALIDAQDAEGNTVLHHSARNAFVNKEEMAWYLSHDADINAQNKKGETPLIIALTHQCWDHIKFLLEHDADVRPKNQEGRDALAITQTYRDSPDLTQMIPLLSLRGDEAVKMAHNIYTNLATIIEQKTLYAIGFKNKTDETVQVALRFMNLDGEWETAFWYRIYPGKEERIKFTKNRIFYFFAESESWQWKGDENRRTIDGTQRGMRKVTIKKSRQGKPYHYTLK